MVPFIINHYLHSVVCLPVVISVKFLLDVIPELLEPFPAAGVDGTGALEHLVHCRVLPAGRFDGLLRKFVFSRVGILDYLTRQLPLHKLTPI